MTETQTITKTEIRESNNGGSRCLQTLVLSQRPLIRAYLCDCMDWMQTTADKAYDLAIVDPPYGVEWKQIFYNDFAKEINWDIKPTREYFNELKRISKNWIISGINYFAKELDDNYSPLIWDKKNGDTHIADGELLGTSIKKPLRIFRHAYFGRYHPEPKKIHPTQKPVALYRWLLKNYAKAGQRILDTHGGSFSSAVACFVEGYDLDIMEIDAEYFEAGVKRFKQATKQMGLFDDRAV